MNDDQPHTVPLERYRRKERHPAILLTSYMTGATAGKNLGVAGYSYDFVTELFIPLLQQFGEVIPVPKPRWNLDRAVRNARARDLEPVHVSFLPLQDVCLAESAPNVVVPAWEFPDVPDHAFDGNPQNDWPATANRCATVIVGGPFTVDALRKAGTTTPIHVVPVPTPEEYFALAPSDPEKRTNLAGSAYVFPQVARLPRRAPVPAKGEVRVSRIKRFGKALEFAVRQTSKRLLGRSLYERITAPIRNKPVTREPNRKTLRLPYARCTDLELSGIVYTSILNPVDGRKNWEDLITAYLCALGDCDDATLVIKLISSRPQPVEKIINYYAGRDIPHRCKLVFVTDYLSDEQMVQLAGASTYYVQATRAEGNCLPLMNYLAGGRPGISPVHSAIGDYFDGKVGFVVDSHPAPSAWPHDRRLRIRTTWGRIVWPSLVEQIRKSYEMAKYDRAAYEALAERGKRKMEQWASVDAVWSRLQEALNATVRREVANDHVARAMRRLAA